MEQADLVLTGAEAVVENGGIINRVMNTILIIYANGNLHLAGWYIHGCIMRKCTEEAVLCVSSKL